MLFPADNRTRRSLPALLLAAVAMAAAACARAPETKPAASAANGEGPAPATPSTPLVTLAGAAEPATVAPGATLTLAWTFRPAAGWHLYGNVRNDSGFAPRQRLRLPEGWEAGPLQWPAPARHLSAGDILDHVYEGELVLLQDVRVPAGAGAGARELRAHWEWLACRDSCVPGRDSLAVAVTVADDAPGSTGPPAALAAARARLPQPLPAGLVRIAWDGDILRLTPEGAAAGRQLAFVPALDCGELADALHDAAGPALALRLLPDEGRIGPVRGLLLVGADGAAPRAYEIDVPAVPAAASGS